MAKPKKLYTYHKHFKDNEPEGHIFIDKKGACTITLTGAAAMTQEELDAYGERIVELLNEN